MKKFSEEIVRYPALTEDGKPCEILERITFERSVLEDGALTEATVINRRFDLRTGEPVTRINEVEFLEDSSGLRLQLQR